jgi:hypothetical protein
VWSAPSFSSPDECQYHLKVQCLKQINVSPLEMYLCVSPNIARGYLSDQKAIGTSLFEWFRRNKLVQVYTFLGGMVIIAKKVYIGTSLFEWFCRNKLVRMVSQEQACSNVHFFGEYCLL